MTRTCTGVQIVGDGWSGSDRRLTYEKVELERRDQVPFLLDMLTVTYDSDDPDGL